MLVILFLIAFYKIIKNIKIIKKLNEVYKCMGITLEVN